MSAAEPKPVRRCDDPAGARPALTDGACGIEGTEIPPHLAAVAGLEIADHHRKVPVSAELGDNLLIQPALVVLARQDQVGALLGGELNNAGEVCSVSAWISTPSSSRVLSKAFRAARSWYSGVKRGLGTRHTPPTCLERDLGHNTRGSISTIDLSC